ncbi:MAG: hypothetical protein H6500_06625 [Candidatus Woesearchaeota archaeon]|nr:MAG: hypothetical protein H6500_06625 [Candidatus Woesearchaeota archaeon]
MFPLEIKVSLYVYGFEEIRKKIMERCWGLQQFSRYDLFTQNWVVAAE